MKEKWESLSDEQKTSAMREFINKVGLNNFDYTKAREQRDRFIKAKSDMAFTCYSDLKNPCLTLKLVDPVLTDFMFAWMYAKSSEHGVAIPFMGYELEEITFNKSTLMEYSDEEKQTLTAAIEILKKKGVSDAKF